MSNAFTSIYTISIYVVKMSAIFVLVVTFFYYNETFIIFHFSPLLSL